MFGVSLVDTDAAALDHTLSSKALCGRLLVYG